MIAILLRLLVASLVGLGLAAHVDAQVYPAPASSSSPPPALPYDLDRLSWPAALVIAAWLYRGRSGRAPLVCVEVRHVPTPLDVPRAPAVD